MEGLDVYIDVNKIKSKSSKAFFGVVCFGGLFVVFLIIVCIEYFFTKTNFNTFFSLVVLIAFMAVVLYISSLSKYTMSRENILKLIDNPQNDIKLTNTIRALYVKNNSVSALDLIPIKRVLGSEINTHLNSKITGEEKSKYTQEEFNVLSKSLNQIEEIFNSMDFRLQRR